MIVELFPPIINISNWKGTWMISVRSWYLRTTCIIELDIKIEWESLQLSDVDM